MSNNVDKKVVIIGTGPMAIAHAKAVQELNVPIMVIGRGAESAAKFNSETGIQPIEGGVDSYLQNNTLSSKDYIIVAVGTEMLMPVLLLLAKQKFARVLIEKPAAISVEELLANQSELQSIQDRVFVAYNRRTYASVIEAKKLIEEDGGLESMHFEFTEWSHKIEPLKKAEGVKENWFFANSTHVVDLAFYIAGLPKDWMAYSKKGTISWHEKTNYSGAGITENGVVFSYLSNWESAGRWGIELLTSKRRIYLKPLEGVQIQDRGTIAVNPHEIDDAVDLTYKPGILVQAKELLFGTPCAPTLKEQFEVSSNVYQKMLGK